MSTSLAPSPDTLMVKTAKGSAEVGTREHRLGPRLRTILIMVDGKLTLEEITVRAAALGNAAAIVGHLLQEGFIEPVGGGPASQPMAQPASQPTVQPMAQPTVQPVAEPTIKAANPLPPAHPPEPVVPFDVTQQLRPVKRPPVAPPPKPLDATQPLKVVDTQPPPKAPPPPPHPFDVTQELIRPVAAPASVPDTGLSRTIRMPALDLSQGVDETTRNMVTELTRSGNLVTLRGDSMSGMRESEATNPARFFMRETMSRLLGGGAVGVLEGIDLATTRERLLTELDTCSQIIQEMKGEHEATGFRVSVLALLPE